MDMTDDIREVTQVIWGTSCEKTQAAIQRSEIAYMRRATEQESLPESLGWATCIMFNSGQFIEVQDSYDDLLKWWRE